MNFKNSLLGVENKKGPFENLTNNIQKIKANNIKLSFSSGLEDVDSIYNCVVIAGMGFDNIRQIITKDINKLNNIDCFIIDSHTKTKETRDFFTSLGYYIEDEKIIFEDKIYYEIIKFRKGESNYSYEELYFGPILLKNESNILVNKYKDILKNNQKITKNLSKDSLKYKSLIKINNLIKDYLNIQ